METSSSMSALARLPARCRISCHKPKSTLRSPPTPPISLSLLTIRNNRPTIHCGISVQPAESTNELHGWPGKEKDIPRHVALIMDGNSRWAKQRGMLAESGHLEGVKALKQIVQTCCQWNINALTVFAFSTENWMRSKKEVHFLMQLFQEELLREFPHFVEKNVSVKFIGNIRSLPQSLQSLIQKVEEATGENTGLKFSIALSYGGRQDIVEAVKRLAERIAAGDLQPSDVSDLAIEKELSTSWLGQVSSPDLVIRTSGERRLSNFLLWQCAYSELYFCDVLWPDFSVAHFQEAIVSYQNRDRRFGARKM